MSNRDPFILKMSGSLLKVQKMAIRSLLSMSRMNMTIDSKVTLGKKFLMQLNTFTGNILELIF